jgi:tRNA(Ile)-lysidine synthase
VRDAVSAAFVAHVAPGARIAIALSGGIDSMVLLDAACGVAATLDVTLSALHVHHGLSANAEQWTAFCADQCQSRGLVLAVHRLGLDRQGGESLEAIASRARHAVFARADVDALMLAHHADDQAETLLLQLLRGAGPRGLASMPVHRASAPALLRPLLQVTRQEIAAYAAASGLPWVDDESNADTGIRRNFLRSEVTSRLAGAFPGYPAMLVRAASHQAEAAQLLDELAAGDAEGAIDRHGLDRARLASLSSPRARNLMRWFLQSQGLRPPSTAHLTDMLRQLCTAAGDARTGIRHDGLEIGCHRGRVVIHATVDRVGPVAAADAVEQVWRGEPEVSVPGGRVVFERVRGEGLDAAKVERAHVTLRARSGGERIRLAANRPRHAVKKLLQASGMPEWDRRALPLVFCDGELALVPAIGVAVQFQAASDQPGWRVDWRPQPVRHD